LEQICQLDILLELPNNPKNFETFTNKVMRTKLLYIIIVFLILGSCTKDIIKDNPKTIEIPTSLIAKWNWISSCGGIAGITYTPQSTGEVRIIEFDVNNNYKYYVNDILKSESKFDIKKFISITNHDSTLMVLIDQRPIRQSIWFHSSDTLILFEECFDCFEHYYTRIK
jgi:hypothetical protein